MTGTPASPAEPRYWPGDPEVSGSGLERADQVLRGGDPAAADLLQSLGDFSQPPEQTENTLA